MKKHVVALDAAALAQLMAASIFLLGLVFLAGAVVGFATHPDGDAGVPASEEVVAVEPMVQEDGTQAAGVAEDRPVGSGAESAVQGEGTQ